MRIQFVYPSPKSGEISHEKAETALPLIAAGLARRVPDPEPPREAKVNWRVETNANSGILWLIGVCTRGGEKFQYSGDPTVLKGAVFQHCCLAKPEPVPESVIKEFARRSAE